jgi:integrase
MTDGEDRDGTTRRRRVKPENSKRASGESSIYRDEDGRWHGFVSMGKKENGRRDRRHVSGAKRADVVAKVRAIEAKRDAGMVDAAGRAPTVGEWLDHWLDNIAARKVRARTLESYRSTVRLHLRPGIGHHRLDRLQPEHLERLYAVLADKGLSPASILRAHRVLSRALRVASQRGKVARNVATLVDPPAVRRPQTALPLSAQEARAPSASGAACTASAVADWSTRSPRPTAAAAPWRSRPHSSRRCAPTGPPSARSALQPARCGRTTTWSSPSPTAGRSSASRTGAPGRPF